MPQSSLVTPDCRQTLLGSVVSLSITHVSNDDFNQTAASPSSFETSAITTCCEDSIIRYPRRPTENIDVDTRHWFADTHTLEAHIAIRHSLCVTYTQVEQDSVDTKCPYLEHDVREPAQIA